VVAASYDIVGGEISFPSSVMKMNGPSARGGCDRAASNLKRGTKTRYCTCTCRNITTAPT